MTKYRVRKRGVNGGPGGATVEIPDNAIQVEARYHDPDDPDAWDPPYSATVFYLEPVEESDES